VITCPAHNSTFAVSDGSRQGGPATRGLTEIPIKVEDTTITRA
jgi:Rieske Fe-S protein